MSPPGDAVDVRADRAIQSLVGVLVLAAFVFRLPWLVPGLAVLLGAGALGGPHLNVFHRAFTAWVTPRLSPADPAATVDSTTVAAQDTLAAAILVVASVMFAIGLAFVGWVLALAEAVIAVLAATTPIHLGDRLPRWR